MSCTQILAAAALVLAACASVRAESWKPGQAPLMTRWAKDVSLQRAHPEYPRPQMVRSDWLNLNGLWDCAIESQDGPAPQYYPGKILVPFPVESALSGVMKRIDEKQRLWYRRTFQAPGKWRGRRVLLHFQAVDWEATVTVNGQRQGVHRGGYDAFTFDITDALKSTGEQELVVKVFDPSSSGQQPRGKQVNNPGGIMYTPSSGIWQTVWLEPAPAARIESLAIVPDVDNACLRLTVAGDGATAGTSVRAIARSGHAECGTASGVVGEELKIQLPEDQLKLWSPESPNLYELYVELQQGKGHRVDSVGSYFAMRKINVARDEKGVPRLRLNGQFLFQTGPLDQGFWPDGLYTAPTDEALRYDIEVTKQLGFNCTRKHVKVEPERWYYWCDKLGLLVWQDMPSGKNESPEAQRQFETELRRLVIGRGNHPSIVMWVVFNEGWGQHDTERYVSLVKQLDPSRLVDNASGWTDKKVGDAIDIHSYPGPAAPKPETARAGVLGEFGGLGLGVDKHTWAKKTWGYRGASGSADLTRRYVELFANAWKLKETKGLSAAIYTQITDVETECNGLLTYDRAIIKVDVPKAAAAASGKN